VGEAALPLGSGLEVSTVWASVVGLGGVEPAAAGSDVGAPHMAS
jgi:hypothetical protein